MEEEQRQKQRAEEEAALKEKELKRKLRGIGRPKLSFQADVGGVRCCFNKKFVLIINMVIKC